MYMKLTYLNVLFVLTLAVLAFSVVFTLAAGQSPLEALGVNPAWATIGFGALILALVLVPRIVRWVTQERQA